MGCTRGYGNGFLKLSLVCMVTKLKVLEFFFGFFRTCARSQGSAVRKSCFWQAHATKPRPMAKGQVEGGKALQAARAAEIDAASHRPTAAQKQQQIAELEERAELFGDPVKQSAQAKVLERKWQRFLVLVHGEAYKFAVARVYPSKPLVP